MKLEQLIMQPDQKNSPPIFQSWILPTLNLKQILFVFVIQINQFPKFPVDKTQKSRDRSKTYPEDDEPLKTSLLYNIRKNKSQIET